jgi:CoA:oxalate CoA-transferase
VITTGDQLRGIEVVDLGIWRPAPYATQLLAELGASVTKVEPPGGDPMRSFPDLYVQLNSRKRVVELDLKAADGRDRLRPLLVAADVVVEGFRPGVADRLGIGPDAVAELNPRAIHCSISGFGQDGPLASAAGHDLNYQAWSGVLAARAPDTGSSGIPVADLAGGMFAALAVCAALARRAGSAGGPGERIDVSMADVLVSWAGPDAGGDLTAGDRPAEGFPAYGTFACADGSITLGVVTDDRFWSDLCSIVGLEDVADLSAVERVSAGPDLRARLAEAIAHRQRDPLVDLLLSAGVPAAPVLERSEAVALEHFRVRGTVADDGHAPRIGHPVRFAPLSGSTPAAGGPRQPSPGA